MREEYSLEVLQERIGYRFRDAALLKQAITHKSYANEMQIKKNHSYERLEFLGDAVLELVTSDFLFHKYSNVLEGQLTKMRASMVCEQTLALCAKSLELGEFMLLGKGEECTGGRFRDSIISDVMEAIIGALYMDGGLEAAREFVDKFIFTDMEKKELFCDSKTTFQEYVQGKLKREYGYRLVSMSGPEHKKIFCIEALVDGEVVGTGYGPTKKSAEQQASGEALKVIMQKNWE